MIQGCMSGKGPGKTAIITSTVKAPVYIEILGTFLIPSVENRFTALAIFQDDNASFATEQRVLMPVKAYPVNDMASKQSVSQSEYKFMVEM